MDTNETVDLVVKVQQGDEQAFTKLFKEYEKLVYFISYQSVHNASDAQDIAQETFIQVKKSINNLNEPKYFKAWLNRITYSKVSRFFEKHKEIAMDMSECNNLTNIKETRTYMLPDKMMRKNSDQKLLHECLKKMKPKYSQVLMLRFFQQLSIQEIAYVLDIPEGTVKSRLSVAKSELKTKIIAIEDREGSHLNFQVGTLEACLLTYFMASFSEVVKVGTAISSLSLLSKLKSRFLIHPVLGIVACSTMVLGVSGFAYFYDEMQRKGNDSNAMQEINRDQEEVFPSLNYEQQIIITPRQAYRVLYDNAHCEKEWDTLSSQQQASLKEIYQSMKIYGGEYQKMAERLEIKDL